MAILAGLAASGSVSAAGEAVTSGDYVYIDGTRGAHGSLRVRGSRFAIETMGGNTSVCALEGTLEAGVGMAQDRYATCRFDIIANGASVRIDVSRSEEACRSFCGYRAGFDGEYLKPPAECTDARRAARIESSRNDYRLKHYEAARAGFRGLVAGCRTFMDWIEIDRVRNDLAVAEFHAGDPAQCLVVLADTVAGRVTNEHDLRIAPLELDAYRAVAAATWHNQALCKGAGRR